MIIKILNESYNKLNESNSLNEAFSPSMPNWLKGFILGHRDTLMRDSKIASYKDKGIDARLRYHDYGPRDYDQDSAYSVMRDKHVDWSKAEFINIPLPVKINDPDVINPDHMTFLKIVIDDDFVGGEYVYCPGYNDKELITVPTRDGSWKKEQLKYVINNKFLANYCTDACYIDLTNPNNFMTDKHNTRIDDKAISQALYDQGLLRQGDSNRKYRSKSRYNIVDKSGYYVQPLKSKYAEKLKELHRNKVVERVEQYREELEQIKSDIIAIMSDVGLNSPDSAIYGRLENTMFKMKGIVQQYSNVVEKQLPDALNEPDERARNYIFDHIVDYELYRLDGKIKDLKSLIAPYIKTNVNWDTDDMWDDDEEF